MTIKLPTYFPPLTSVVPRRLAPIRWPHALEQEYAQAVRDQAARRFNRGVREIILPRLGTMLARSERKLVQRADADLGESLVTMVEQLRRRFFIRRRDAEVTARRYLTAIDRFHANAFGAEYGSVLSINPLLGQEKWLRDAMSVGIQENADLITSIPEESLGTVRRLVNDAVMGGRRPEELAAQLLERFDITENRALLIATDQTGKWYGTVQRLRQKDAGCDRYVWSTSNDARVRMEHVAREGRTFSWDDPPRDGHPGMPIRCVPGSTRVDALGAVHVAFRRPHHGKLTTLITESGESFRCTPNHPVLTQRGWIAAEATQKGDQLFRAPVEGLFGRHEDLDQVQTVASQAFHALAAVGSIAQRSGSREDFHGDGSAHDQVDVVTLDWSLAPDAQAGSLREVCQLALEAADVRLATSARAGDLQAVFKRCGLTANSSVRGFCKLLSLVLGGPAHAYEHRAATAAWLETAPLQLVAERLAREPRALLDGLRALTSEVGCDQRIAVDLFRIVRHAVDLPAQVGIDATRAEILAQQVGVDVERSRDRRDPPFAREQGLRIAQKLIGESSGGHVYNFETPHGWYTANGLVLHNCRCVAIPEIE